MTVTVGVGCLAPGVDAEAFAGRALRPFVSRLAGEARVQSKTAEAKACECVESEIRFVLPLLQYLYVLASNRFNSSTGAKGGVTTDIIVYNMTTYLPRSATLLILTAVMRPDKELTNSFYPRTHLAFPRA